MKKQLMLTVVPIYSLGFLFNVTLLLIALVIPLFGLSMGYSATQIGILLSIPGLLQVFLRMFAGRLSDRFGEKNMLAFTFCLIIAASLIFSFDLSFFTLAFFQILMGITRTIFWPTSQSYASRIPTDETSSILGKFHSFNEAGKILGIILAGWAITNIGYLGTFRLITVFGVLGLLIVGFMESIPRNIGEHAPINKAKESFRDLLKVPALQFALIIAYFAGLFVALTQSFFPIWLKGLGTSEGLLSLILTVNLAGSLLAGRYYGIMQKRTSTPLLLQLSIGSVGAGFILVAIIKGLLSIFLLNLSLGFFMGIVAIIYQVMVVDHSTALNRGVVLSFVGLGWGTAFLTGPALFGLLVDGITIKIAFGCLGALVLLYAGLIKAMYPRFIGSAQQSQNVKPPRQHTV